jgi:hypothetical protein
MKPMNSDATRNCRKIANTDVPPVMALSKAARSEKNGTNGIYVFTKT